MGQVDVYLSAVESNRIELTALFILNDFSPEKLTRTRDSKIKSAKVVFILEAYLSIVVDKKNQAKKLYKFYREKTQNKVPLRSRAKSRQSRGKVGSGVSAGHGDSCN